MKNEQKIYELKQKLELLYQQKFNVSFQIEEIEEELVTLTSKKVLGLFSFSNKSALEKVYKIGRKYAQDNMESIIKEIKK